MVEINSNTHKEKDYVLDLDISRVYRALIKHRQTFIAVFFIALVSSLIYSFTATPIFQAKSRLIIDRRPPKIVKVEDMVIADYNSPVNFLNSQIEILKSRTLANMVLEQLGEYEPWEFRSKPDEEIKKLTVDKRLEALNKHVKISPVRMTEIIDVVVDDPDPKLAARIANTWTQAYVLFSSVDQLIQRRGELEADLVQRLKYLKEKNPIILGLHNEIDSINEKIENERVRLSQTDNQSQAVLSFNGENANVKILELAQIPVKPARPQKALTLVLAVAIGLFFAALLVFVMESVDQKIATVSDLEHLVNFPCGVSIPQLKNKKLLGNQIPELICENIQNSFEVEAFRHLRTNIIFSNPDFSKQKIMVTSSSTSEGKTMTATNLAIVFAQTGERTLLVDADMRRPRLHEIFKVDHTQGLSNVLVSKLDNFQACIHKTNIPNLEVLPCGEVPPNPSELLVSQKMEQFIAKISQVYDRIIFDSPPLLPVTDAAILSTKVDATILIARSDYTHRQALLNSVKALKAVDARILAVVLNMAEISKSQGYHYGYAPYEPKVSSKIATKAKTAREKV